MSTDNIFFRITDAFKKADEGGFEFQYANGSTGYDKTALNIILLLPMHSLYWLYIYILCRTTACKISEATKDPAAFLALTDNVLVEQIKYYSALEASTTNIAGMNDEAKKLAAIKKVRRFYVNNWNE